MKKLSIILIITLLSLSCAARIAKMRNNIANKYAINNPDVSPQIIKAMKSGHVIIGMTMEQVKLIWGNASRRHTSTFIGDTYYEILEYKFWYHFLVPNPQYETGILVHFRNSKVYAIQY